MEIRYNEYIHSMPMACIMVDFMLLKPQFPKKHVRNIIWFFVLTSIVNALYSILEGPLYFFLTYKDIITPLFLLACLGMVIGAHRLGAIFHRMHMKAHKQLQQAGLSKKSVKVN